MWEKHCCPCISLKSWTAQRVYEENVTSAILPNKETSASLIVSLGLSS